MNYDDMPAGPELDALIIEKVMRWRMVFQDEHGDHMEDSGGDGISHGPFLPRFAPSTNIAHAWEVLEKVASIGWLWASCGVDNGPETARARPGVRHWCRIQPHSEVWADTVPLAICRAVLKAVGK